LQAVPEFGLISPFERLRDLTRTVASASAKPSVVSGVGRLKGEWDETLVCGGGK
jgi:hypothetical protein